jgi:MFS family permease
MKLNTKRTVLVGLAFLSICAFWQMYDSVVPLILTNTFHMNETFSGAIMAADNVLALFLLPLFGAISDRCTSKLGKRRPFILFGTGCADHPHEPAAAARQQLRRRGQPVQARVVRRRAGAAARRDGHLPQPRRGAHARRDAQAPALARNAIINLMGAVGGLLYLGVAAALYPNAKVAGLSHVDYQPLFLVVSAIMFLAVGAMFLTVREPKLTAENQALEKRHPEWNLATRTPRAMRCCPRPSSAASASCWPPSPCGSSATTASRPGLRPTSRRSWARGWAGPRPAFSSRRRAPSSRTSPSARWRRRSAAAAPSRAASCC